MSRIRGWRSRLFGVLSALGIVVVTGHAQTPPKPVEVRLPELKRIEAFPSVIEMAAEKNVPMSGIAGPIEREGMRKGDSVTALVSEIDGDKVRQWLVFLKSDPPDEEAAKRLTAPAELIMHSTSGRVLKLPGRIGAVAIRVIGPFSGGKDGGKKAKDRWSGTQVNQSFLGLGLDRACEMLIQIDRLAKERPADVPAGFGVGFGTQPYPAEGWAANRGVLDRLGIGEAEERALVGSFPALSTFLQIALQTPGLDEVLRRVTDVSWFSVLKSGGNLSPYFQYLNPFTQLSAEMWRLPAGMKCYSFKFQLSLLGKPALNCELVVAAPRPPLLTSAGVIALGAQRPDGKGPVLLMHVIDARCAEGTAEVAAKAVPGGAANRAGDAKTGTL